MKKFIALSLFMFPCIAFAQFNRGQVFLGGSLSTSLQNTDVKNMTVVSGNTTKYNILSLSPSVGFFLNQKLSIGANVNYTTSHQEYDYLSYAGSNNGVPIYVNSSQKNVSNSYGIGSFAKYYVPLSNSFYFAFQGQLSFNRGSTENIQNNAGNETTQKTPTYNIGLNFRPSFIFFPTPNWGIEAAIGSFGYNYSRNLPDVSSTNSFALSAGSFGFGLAYYFAKK